MANKKEIPPHLNEMLNQELQQMKWYEQVLHAERQNPDYNKRDIHTYTQEPLCELPADDLEAHCFADQKGISRSHGVNGYMSGGFHSESHNQAVNLVLKFTNPKACVKITTKLLPSLLTPFIVDRYKLYDRKNFTIGTLIHRQQVKYFYRSSGQRFVVALPDHFYDSLDQTVLPPPRFEYKTEEELLKQYPKDLMEFAEVYFSIFARYRKGQRVIMVYSSRENKANSVFSPKYTNSDDPFSETTMAFGSEMSIARGVLYGELFYQINNDGEIETRHSQRLEQVSKQGYLMKDRNIHYCIPDEPGQWEQMTAILETFTKAQATLDAILTESRDENALIGAPISLPALDNAFRQQFLPDLSRTEEDSE